GRHGDADLPHRPGGTGDHRHGEGAERARSDRVLTGGFHMDVHAVSQNVVVWLTAFGFKVLGALGFWIVGRWLIHLALSFISRALRSQNVDPTLQAYLGSIIAVALNVVLVVAILGFFGIETTSFAALLAAAGIAIGAAWAG